MRIAIIGDYAPNSLTHQATDAAIAHSADYLGISLIADWVATQWIEEEYEQITNDYAGYLIAPGSTYKGKEGALAVIKAARTKGLPFLATCAGMQMAIVEFARNVLAIPDAEHEEYEPFAERLVVNKLRCSLAGQRLDIHFTDTQSKACQAYGKDTISEQHFCRFGVNSHYENKIDASGFRIVARGDDDDLPRIFELDEHPFYIGTLFVPQALSRAEAPHPLVTEFVRCVARTTEAAKA